MEGAEATCPELSANFCTSQRARLGGALSSTYEVWMHIETTFASQWCTRVINTRMALATTQKGLCTVVQKGSSTAVEYTWLTICHLRGRSLMMRNCVLTPWRILLVVAGL
jgi:hypothetical protein